jgi:hypothetical protein
MFKVHGFLDNKRVINGRMAHLPRVGETVRLAGDSYGIVTEVIWCMDESTQEGQRVNIRMESEIETEESRTPCDAQNYAMSQSQVLSWINEDELPSGYPYDSMFPFSKVDIVRMFPVFAPPAPAAPEGWKLVPIQPTPEMLEAVDPHGECRFHSEANGDGIYAKQCVEIYQAFLDAAPDAP